MYSSSNDETNIAGLLKNGPGLSRCISYWTSGIFQPAILVYQSVDFFELVQSSMTATQNLIRDDASMFQHFVREVVQYHSSAIPRRTHVYIYILITCFLFNTLSGTLQESQIHIHTHVSSKVHNAKKKGLSRKSIDTPQKTRPWQFCWWPFWDGEWKRDPFKWLRKGHELNHLVVLPFRI